MKQCAGDSSESRKCLNLSSSSHTAAVREGTVRVRSGEVGGGEEGSAGLGPRGWRGTKLSSLLSF